MQKSPSYHHTHPLQRLTTKTVAGAVASSGVPQARTRQANTRDLAGRGGRDVTAGRWGPPCCCTSVLTAASPQRPAAGNCASPGGHNTPPQSVSTVVMLSSLSEEIFTAKCRRVVIQSFSDPRFTVAGLGENAPLPTSPLLRIFRSP